VLCTFILHLVGRWRKILLGVCTPNMGDAYPPPAIWGIGRAVCPRMGVNPIVAGSLE
jgi:hypothetical protein